MTVLMPDKPGDNAQTTEAGNAQIEHYAPSDEPTLESLEATSPMSHNNISQRSSVTIQKTIPASCLGSWAPNEYVSINIHPDKIEGYESEIRFPDKIEVTGDGKTINLLGIDHIEGEVFKRKQTLKISGDGSTLTIEGKGYSTQYNRTEPGPPKGG